MQARHVELIKQLFGLKTDEQLNSFNDIFGLGAENSEMAKRLDRIAYLQDYLYKDPANSLDAKVKEVDKKRLQDPKLNSRVSSALARDRASQFVAGAMTLDNAHLFDVFNTTSASEKAWREEQEKADVYRQIALNNSEQLKSEVQRLQADIFSEHRTAGDGGQHSFNLSLVAKRKELEKAVKDCKDSPDAPGKPEELEKAKKALAEFNKMTGGFGEGAKRFELDHADKAQQVQHRANRVTGPAQYNDLVSARKRREALGQSQDEELENAEFFAAKKFVRASGVGWNSFMFKKEKGRKMPRALTLPEMKVKKDPKTHQAMRDPKTGEKLWEMTFDRETLEVLPYLSPAEEMKFFVEVARRNRAAGRTTVEMTNDDGSVCTSHGCLARLNKYLKACAKIGYYPDATEYLKACEKADAAKDETVRQWLAGMLPTELAYFAGGNPYNEAMRLNKTSSQEREKQGKALAGGALSQELREARELYKDAGNGLNTSTGGGLIGLQGGLNSAPDQGANRPQDFAEKAEQLKQKTELNAKRLSALQHQLQVVNNLHGSDDRKELFKQLLDEQTKEVLQSRTPAGDFHSSNSFEGARQQYIEKVIQPEVQKLSTDMQALQLEKDAFDQIMQGECCWRNGTQEQFIQCDDSDAITRVDKVAQALNGGSSEPGASRPEKSFDEVSRAITTLSQNVDESLTAEHGARAGAG